MNDFNEILEGRKSVKGFDPDYKIPHEEMNEIHKHFYGSITDQLKDQYNIIVVRDRNRAGDMKFECYGSAYEEKEFLELKQQILSKLK